MPTWKPQTPCQACQTRQNSNKHTLAQASIFPKISKNPLDHQPRGAKKLKGNIGRLRSAPNKTTQTRIDTITTGEKPLSSKSRPLFAGSIRPTALTRRNGTLETIKGLYPKAAVSRPCNKWCKARVEPHPGQYHPVKYLNGHGGNQRLSTGLYFTNKTETSTAPRKSTP